MDAAPLAHRDTRRCARPGCADLAMATLSFRYDLSQAWVMPLTDDPSPATYDLCGPCADRTRPPRGWHLVDERPDLDAAAAMPDEHDVVRAAIAAALRGQSTPLEVLPDVPGGVSADPLSATAPTAVLRSVPDPAPAAPAVPVAPAIPDASADTDRPARRRPVEVLIQPVEAMAPPVGPAPSAEAHATVAGDDDLVAALREHQDRVARQAIDTALPDRRPDTAIEEPTPEPGGVADFFATRPTVPARSVAQVRPVPPPGTMQVPAATAEVLTSDSTPAVLAEALQRVVAELPGPGRHVRGANVPLAFDEVPGRLVALDELGEFDEADLVAGLRERPQGPSAR